MLAETVGLHRSFIADLEQGKRNVSILNLHAISTALEISVEAAHPTLIFTSWQPRPTFVQTQGLQNYTTISPLIVLGFEALSFESGAHAKLIRREPRMGTPSRNSIRSICPPPTNASTSSNSTSGRMISSETDAVLNGSNGSQS